MQLDTRPDVDANANANANADSNGSADAESDTSRSFRQWLREQRKDRLGYTQEEFARLVGCSVVTIRGIEQGVLRPSLQLAELIAEGLQLPAQERAAVARWARTDPLKAQPPRPSPPVLLHPLPHASPLEVLPGSEQDKPAQARNPYKGLRPFYEADASDFFGREALTARLLARLCEQTELRRFLAVVGPSGSGKSSVVRAGLIPALKRDGLPGGVQPVVADFVPGTHPIEELEAALLRVAANPPPSLIEQLRAGERGLARAVKRVLPNGPNGNADTTNIANTALLLIIDQFEEIFTLAQSEDTRALLVDSICEAVTDPRTPLWVVVTLRADFYDRPLLYANACRLMRERTEVVGPLEPDELLQAIVRPAQQVGVELEPELVATVQQEAGNQAGALPLMEYALTELFERRDGVMMKLSAYRESGGVQGALGRRAEEIFCGLTRSEQEEARQLFLRLVTLGEGVEDTRRRALRSELASAAGDEEAFEGVLEVFGEHRLLTFDRDPVTRGPTLEVAHEALLRAWARLRGWLDESRSDLRTQRQLMAEAVEWEHSGKDPSYLATGARLTQFKALAEAADQAGGIALTAEEKEYLATSVEESERQDKLERERQAKELELARRAAASQRAAASRLRYLLAGAVVFLAVAAILAIWALSQSQAADSNASEANTERHAAQNNAATAVANQGEADKQRQQAEDNLKHSEAQRLAAEANRLLQTDAISELIGLLSVRSLDYGYTRQGDEALRGAAALNYPLRSFVGHTDVVYDAAFSPDGKFVATAGWDSTARLWDAATGTQIRSFPGATQLHEVVFSPDGKLLLVVGGPPTSAPVRLYDVATGQEVRHFTQRTSTWSAAYSPDGRDIAMGSRDGTAQLYDASTGQEVRVFSGHTQPLSVNGVAFSPDGRYLATGSWDGTARLWDVQTGKELRSFTGHTGWVQSVAFSADGKWLLTGSTDRSMRLWDVATGQELRHFALGGPVSDARFSPDGRYIAVAAAGNFESGNPALLLDSQTGTEVARYVGHQSQVGTLEFSPDGRYLLTSGDTTAQLWDLSAVASAPLYVGHSGAILHAAYSPDGKYLLTGSSDKTARLWDAATGKELRRFTGHTGGVNRVAFSPDGKYVLTGSADKTARLWDVSTGNELTRFAGHADEVMSVDMSPDDKYVLTAAYGKTVRVWDAMSGQLVRTLTTTLQTARPMVTASYSPDGRYVLASGINSTAQDDAVWLWDAQTGKQVHSFSAHTYKANLAYFTPDGTHIVVGGQDGSVGLWDLSDGHVVRRFMGHTGVVNHMTLSQGGRYLLTGSGDGTARLWETVTGREVRRLNLPKAAGGSGVSSPDGKWLLVYFRDNTLRAYLADYQAAVKDLCSRLDRDFTDQERAEYDIKDTQPTCSKQ